MEQYILSKAYDGKLRKLFKLKCKCGKEFHAPKYKNRKYCSKECSGLNNRTRILVKCSQCNLEFEKRISSYEKSKSGLVFCSRVCKDLAQRLESNHTEIHPTHYGTRNGKSSYRSKVDTSKCSGCGDKRSFIIFVHHIDGDRSNNLLENLEAVCPNCHVVRHLKYENNIWRYDTNSLTPRDKLYELTNGGVVLT